MDTASLWYRVDEMAFIIPRLFPFLYFLIHAPSEIHKIVPAYKITARSMR